MFLFHLLYPRKTSMLQFFMITTILLIADSFLLCSDKNPNPIPTILGKKRKYVRKNKPQTNSSLIPTQTDGQSIQAPFQATSIAPIIAPETSLLVYQRYNGKKQSFAPGQRIRNLYDENKPYRLSRSQLENFLQCQRCFHIDRKLGVSRPAGYPFSLNNAVDKLFKTEFDHHREQQTVHPSFAENGIDAVPFQHPDIDKWRNSLTQGFEYQLPETNITACGGIDDIVLNRTTGKVSIVDYKATSKDGEVSLDAPWQDAYKRQMEIYQYLAEKEGLPVCKTGYFVYANGISTEPAFENQLKFKTKLIPYEGDFSWVEQAFVAAYQCLQSKKIPASSPTCQHCQYIAHVNRHTQEDEKVE